MIISKIVNTTNYIVTDDKLSKIVRVKVNGFNKTAMGVNLLGHSLDWGGWDGDCPYKEHQLQQVTGPIAKFKHVAKRLKAIYCSYPDA